ncbi:unnamed protein product [Sphagnum jensenii]
MSTETTTVTENTTTTEAASLSVSTTTPKARRGFALLSPERRKELSRKGGLTAHQLGVAHQWSSEAAKLAGSLGGKAPPTQGLTLAHNSVLALVPGDKTEGMKALLNSEYGKALLSLTIGVGVEYLPNKGERVIKIAKEFRIGAITKAGNEIISTVVGAAMAALSSEEEVKEQLTDSPNQTLHFPSISDHSETSSPAKK